MKKQLLILAAFLVVNCQLIIDNCFAQQTNQAEQYNSERIKLLQQQLGELKKTSSEEKQQMQAEKDSVFQKVALNQLRIEWRLGAETRTKAIEDIRLQLENITAAAAAHKKLSEERTTSLAYFQQQMEDKLDAINRSADGMTDELKKEIKNMEQRISAVEIIKAQ